jgi:hypothetical protein
MYLATFRAAILSERRPMCTTGTVRRPGDCGAGHTDGCVCGCAGRADGRSPTAADRRRDRMTGRTAPDCAPRSAWDCILALACCCSVGGVLCGAGLFSWRGAGGMHGLAARPQHPRKARWSRSRKPNPQPHCTLLRLQHAAPALHPASMRQADARAAGWVARARSVCVPCAPEEELGTGRVTRAPTAHNI